MTFDDGVMPGGRDFVRARHSFHRCPPLVNVNEWSADVLQ